MSVSILVSPSIPLQLTANLFLQGSLSVSASLPPALPFPLVALSFFALHLSDSPQGVYTPCNNLSQMQLRRHRGFPCPKKKEAI